MFGVNQEDNGSEQKYFGVFGAVLYTSLYYKPEKLALCYITLSKETSEDLGVMLTELKLHGIDQVVGMDWDLLLKLNPILEGNYGIALLDYSECELILPFDLYQDFFSAHTWNNIDEYEMFLRMTIWPEEIKVKVH